MLSCFPFSAPDEFAERVCLALQGTPEADLAATLLLPKDEARFLRRDLQGSATPSAPQSASGAAQHTQQAGHAANSSATWQVLSAGKLSNALVDAQQHAPGTDAKQVEQAAAAKVEATLSVATTSATVRDAADCQFANSADAQHHIDTARPGNAAHVSAVSHRPHGKRGAAAMLEQPGGACSSQATEMAVRSPHTKGSFQQPEFVQLLRLRSVTKKRKRHGTAKQQAIEDSVVSNSRCRQRHMSLVEAQVDNHEVQSTPVKKVPT